MVDPSTPPRLPATVREAIQRQIGKGREGALILSTGNAIKQLRREFPHLPAADKDLIDEIARMAVANGIAVQFDTREDDA